jgi:hypothetical protein
MAPPYGIFNSGRALDIGATVTDQGQGQLAGIASDSSSSSANYEITHSVQETVECLMNEFYIYGIVANYVYANGCGNVYVSKTSEQQLLKVTLPAKSLPSGQPTAKVSVTSLEVTYNDLYGAPMTSSYNISRSSPTTALDRTVVDYLDLELAMRRVEAYKTNSEYILVDGKDIDEPTKRLSKVFNNPALDTTFKEKTVSVSFVVFNL